MTKRDHLVPEEVERADGARTTVYKNPDKGKKKAREVAASKRDAVPTAVPSVVQEEDDRPVSPNHFTPDPEWGYRLLHRRGYRIIASFARLRREDLEDVTSRLARAGKMSDEDYARALANSLRKWDHVGRLRHSKSLEIEEENYLASDKRYDALTDLSTNGKCLRIIQEHVNETKADEEVPDVSEEDVRDAVILLRDATSDRDRALQARAYAIARAYSIRARRQKLLKQLAELDSQADELADGLRDLYTGSGEKETIDLGGDDGDAKGNLTHR